jgi:pyruvate formate lyase activating enzyme
VGRSPRYNSIAGAAREDAFGPAVITMMPENLVAKSEPESAQAAPPLLGRVFDIQRFSLHDGPGIRTTVFLKGCPLRCVWCHNPEGMTPTPEVSFLVEKCIACGECARVCEHGAHLLKTSNTQGSEATHVYDRNACQACGDCTEYCDAGTLEFVGRAMSVEDVMKEVTQDRAFYANSGGGLTISGGEPLAQIDFTVALLQAAREQGFHRCLETSGFASWQRFQPLLPLVDLFLFDCKETDEPRHRNFTGQSNLLIIDNLRSLHAAGAKIQLQCPVVPGFNDRQDHFAGIAELAKSLPHLEGIRLLPYHPLGESKLQRFGLNPSPNVPHEPLDPAQLDHWASWLRGTGVRVLNTDAVPASTPSP